MESPGVATRDDAPDAPWSSLRRLRSAQRLRVVGQLAPITVLLGTLLVAPLAVFIVYSFWRTQSFNIVAEWTLDNYRTSVSGPYLTLLRNTLVIAGITAFLATTIAYAFAHAIRFHLRRWQEPLLLVLLIALFSGYLVRIYAWRTILGDTGIINSALEKMGLIDQPLSFLLYNRFAAILVLVNFMIPLAVLPIYSALQNVRDEEIEAGRDLGASAMRTGRGIIFPMVWKGVFFAFALTFVVSAGDYVTPEFVGGTSGQMIGRTVADTFLNAFDWPLGSALAALTLIAVLLVLAIVRKTLEWAVR